MKSEGCSLMGKKVWSEKLYSQKKKDKQLEKSIEYKVRN